MKRVLFIGEICFIALLLTVLDLSAQDVPKCIDCSPMDFCFLCACVDFFPVCFSHSGVKLRYSRWLFGIHESRAFHCLVPEERNLFPFMNVLENLELGAFQKRARQKKSRTLEWIYELFPPLKAHSRQKAHTLSGGEQQMVAIGRALMSAPKLLMMDEPSQGLAPLLVEELFRTMTQISTQGISILLVEQNAYQALRLAQRAYVLENGRIVKGGNASDLLQDPAIRTAYLGM